MDRWSLTFLSSDYTEICLDRGRVHMQQMWTRASPSAAGGADAPKVLIVGRPRPAQKKKKKEKKTWAAIFDVYVVRHLAVLECRECVDPSTRRCARVIIPFFFFWKVVCSRAPSCAQHAVRQRWTLLLFPSTAHRQWDGGRQLHRDWWPCHDGHHHGVRVPYRSAPKRSFHKKIYIFPHLDQQRVSRRLTFPPHGQEKKLLK